MAGYKLPVKSSAAKEIEAVDSKDDRLRIVEKLGTLQTNPRSYGSEKLTGYDDRYRLRQGNYRIVYLIDDTRREVIIFKVGQRRDVYR